MLKFLSTDNATDEAGGITIILWSFLNRRTKNNWSLPHFYTLSHSPNQHHLLKDIYVVFLKS